jgi:hypothetical protein
MTARISNGASRWRLIDPACGNSLDVRQYGGWWLEPTAVIF